MNNILGGFVIFGSMVSTKYLSDYWYRKQLENHQKKLDESIKKLI